MEQSPIRQGRESPDEGSGLWRAVLEALESNAKTARLVLILIVLTAAVVVIARVRM